MIDFIGPWQLCAADVLFCIYASGLFLAVRYFVALLCVDYATPITFNDHAQMDRLYNDIHK